MTDKITIQVDLATRELPYLTILKALLERKNGIGVDLIPQDPIWNNGTSSFFRSARKPCSLLVTPSYNSKRTLNTLAWKHLSKSKLVHFHSEQLIDPRFYEEKLNTQCSSLYHRDVEYHLVWGEEFAKLLCDVAKVPKERIYIVGCPKLSVINKKECTHLTSNNMKTVLFVSDFLWATMSPDQYSSAMSKYAIRPEDNFHGFYKAALIKFIETARQFAESNPDILVVIRPHPGESQEAYQDLLAFNNVSIDMGTPFIESAAKADLIVQFLSTSYFESIYLGKPVICLDLVDGWGTHYRDYFKYYNFVSINDFASIAQRYLKDSHKNAKADETCLNNLFSANKGDSVVRSAAALLHILSIAKETHPTITLRDKSRSTLFLLQHAIKNLAGSVSITLLSAGIKNKFVDRVKSAQLRWEESPDYFDEGTITLTTEKFCTPKYFDENLSIQITKTKYGNMVEAMKKAHQ